LSYKGDLTGGALLIKETKKLAPYLLSNIQKEDFINAIFNDNLLETRAYNSSKRKANLIRKRMILLGDDFINLLTVSDYGLSAQICMAGAIKQSKLLADFMRYVVAEHYKLSRECIEKYAFKDFVEEMKNEHPEELNFSESTLKKATQITFLILTEAGYLESTKTRVLQKNFIRPELKSLLISNGDNKILKCMDIAL
jgi:hypothetical protein